MSYDGFCKRGMHELTAVVTTTGWGSYVTTVYCTHCPFHYNPQSEYLNGKEEEAGGQAEEEESGSTPASEEVKSPWQWFSPPNRYAGGITITNNSVYTIFL